MSRPGLNKVAAGCLQLTHEACCILSWQASMLLCNVLQKQKSTVEVARLAFPVQLAVCDTPIHMCSISQPVVCWQCDPMSNDPGSFRSVKHLHITSIITA